MQDSRLVPRANRLSTTIAIGGLLAASMVAPMGAGGHDAKAAGFQTSLAPMLLALAPGGSVTPIISTGDAIGGYEFQAIPDGIAIDPDGEGGSADVYVNHETSRVPFPLQSGGSAWLPTTNGNGNQNDFLNSQLSKLRISAKNTSVTKASFAIDSDGLYQRFCSNTLATKAQGFQRSMVFANEEGIDWVNTEDPAFPAFPGSADARQIGAVVAYDVANGKYRTIWGLGRLNHENSMAVPGYGGPVLITGDDSFTNVPAQSQLYQYSAKDSGDVWNDKGDLWAFASSDPAYQKYEDFVAGGGAVTSGTFIKVPKIIATGKNPDGSELMAGDVPAEFGGPYPLPPNPGDPTNLWQAFNNVGIDGPQWVLEYWSRNVAHAFSFVRIEDTAYDKRPGMSNVLYLVDSGRGAGGAIAPGKSTNGRVWKMVLDPTDSTKVESLSILIEGDDKEVKDPARIHQPDNIESTVNGLYITEDPGSQQNFPFGSINPSSPNFDPRATNARIWQYKLSDGAMAPVAVVDQTQDEGSGDVDPVPAGTHGFWEASGIVDASSVFGPGAFLVSIQAHSLWVEGAFVSDTLTRAGGNWSLGPDGFPDWVDKREGGQLVLLRIPGA